MPEAVSTPTATPAPTAPPAPETAPAPEGTPAQAPEAKPDAARTQDDPKFASKFAALSRKEREFQQKVQIEQARLKAEAEQLSRWRAAEEAVKGGKRSEALKALGIDWNVLAEDYLAESATAPQKELSEVKKKVEAMETERRKELEAQKQAEVEAEDKRIKATLTGYQEHLTGYIKSKAEQYELINALESFNDVFDVIQQHFAETGKVLSEDEACGYVEAYLEKEAEKEARRLLNTKKLKSLLGSQEPRQQVPAPGQPANPRPKTITNEHASVVATREEKPLTDEERRERVVKNIEARLRGKQ